QPFVPLASFHFSLSPCERGRDPSRQRSEGEGEAPTSCAEPPCLLANAGRLCMMRASPRQALMLAAASGRGRSSGVEHNLAKVGVEGSNPFARSRIQQHARTTGSIRGGRRHACAAAPAGAPCRLSALGG